MKSTAVFLLVAVLMASCATPAPVWRELSNEREREYDSYLVTGTATLEGQAFLAQRNGNTVRAAGREVTLDPATETGNEWWGKAGRLWLFRGLVPPSPGFVKARRTTTADADGRFRFKALPAGSYYVRTEVTWEAGMQPQGGLVGRLVVLEEGKTTEVILNSFAK